MTLSTMSSKYTSRPSTMCTATSGATGFQARIDGRGAGGVSVDLDGAPPADARGRRALHGEGQHLTQRDAGLAGRFVPFGRQTGHGCDEEHAGLVVEAMRASLVGRFRPDSASEEDVPKLSPAASISASDTFLRFCSLVNIVDPFSDCMCRVCKRVA